MLRYRYYRRAIMRAVPVLAWLPFVSRYYRFPRVRLAQEAGGLVLREDGQALEV